MDLFDPRTKQEVPVLLSHVDESGWISVKVVMAWPHKTSKARIMATVVSPVLSEGKSYKFEVHLEGPCYDARDKLQFKMGQSIEFSLKGAVAVAKQKPVGAGGGAIVNLPIELKFPRGAIFRIKAGPVVNLFPTKQPSPATEQKALEPLPQASSSKLAVAEPELRRPVSCEVVDPPLPKSTPVARLTTAVSAKRKSSSEELRGPAKSRKISPQPSTTTGATLKGKECAPPLPDPLPPARTNSFIKSVQVHNRGPLLKRSSLLDVPPIGADWSSTPEDPPKPDGHAAKTPAVGRKRKQLPDAMPPPPVPPPPKIVSTKDKHKRSMTLEEMKPGPAAEASRQAIDEAKREKEEDVPKPLTKRQKKRERREKNKDNQAPVNLEREQPKHLEDTTAPKIAVPKPPADISRLVHVPSPVQQKIPVPEEQQVLVQPISPVRPNPAPPAPPTVDLPMPPPPTTTAVERPSSSSVLPTPPLAAVVPPADNLFMEFSAQNGIAYHPLRLYSNAGGYFNVIAVLKEKSVLKGGQNGLDYNQTITLVDPSGSLSVICFKSEQQWLPPAEPGDVVLLRSVMPPYGRYKAAVGNSHLTSAVLSYGTNRLKAVTAHFVAPNDHEEKRMRSLAFWNANLGDSGIHPPPALEDLGANSVVALGIRRQLMSEIGPGRGAFDCIFEVLGTKPLEGLSFKKAFVYVTDYTPAPGVCDPGFAHDDPGLIDCVVRVEMWDAAATFGEILEKGDYVFIGGATFKDKGSYGKCIEVRKSTARKKLDANTEDEGLRALLARKQEHERGNPCVGAVKKSVFPHHLIGDVSTIAGTRFDCTVRVAARFQNKGANCVIHVTDYTSNPDIPSPQDDRWSYDIPTDRVLAIDMWKDAGDYALANIAQGDYLLLQDVSMVAANGFSGVRAKMNRATIVKLSKSDADYSPEFIALLERQEGWEKEKNIVPTIPHVLMSSIIPTNVKACNVTVELLHVDENRLWVTDYTRSRPKGDPPGIKEGQDWMAGLDSGEIMPVELQDRQPELASALQLGSIYTIEGLRPRPRQPAILSGDERHFVESEDERARGLVKRKESRLKQVKNRQVKHVEDGPLKDVGNLPQEEDTTKTCIRTMEAYDGGHKKFTLVARVVDFEPSKVERWFRAECLVCEKTLDEHKKRCTNSQDGCGDEEPRYTFEFKIFLEDEDGDFIVACVDSGHSLSLLGGLDPPDESYPLDTTAHQKVRNHLKPIIGVVPSERGEEMRHLDGSSPMLRFTLASWPIEVNHGVVLKRGYGVLGHELVY